MSYVEVVTSFGILLHTFPPQYEIIYAAGILISVPTYASFMGHRIHPVYIGCNEVRVDIMLHQYTFPMLVRATRTLPERTYCCAVGTQDTLGGPKVRTIYPEGHSDYPFDLA